MRFRSTVVAAMLSMASMLATPLSAWSSVANELSQLDRAEQQEFQRIVRSVDGWDGTEETFKDVSAAMRRFLDRHPDFVPVMVEDTRLQWARTNGLFGIVNASKSFLPVYLELQRMAPEYPKSYLFAARSYIFTQDYQGALPSLERATELSNGDPWVDLTWALLHERKLEAKLAVEAAQKAIPKAGDNVGAMAVAISTIARNYGVTDREGAAALAKSIYAEKPDRAFIAAVVSTALDNYFYQPGLLDVVAELANIAAAELGPDPALLLAWSRTALLSGNLYDGNGSRRFDPVFMRPAEDILFSIKDNPDVAEAAWGLRIDIALSKNEWDAAQRLLDEGRRLAYSERKVARKTARLLRAQNRPREIVELYQLLRLPDDDVVVEAMAMTGDRDFARIYYLRKIEEDPTNAYLKGNYASFVLDYFDDPIEAVDYAQQAYTLTPYPLAQHVLVSAYLTLSGQELRSGNLAAGRQYYNQAAALDFQENAVLQTCYKNCQEIAAALTAFR